MTDAVPLGVTDPAEVWRLRALDASVQLASAASSAVEHQATIAALRARLDQAEASLERVLRSRSWRLTAPLRRGSTPTAPAPVAGEGEGDPAARHALFEQRMRAAYDARRIVWPDPQTPTTFNEKVWHRRLTDRRPILRTWCDKVAALELARAVVGDDVMPERLAVADTAADLSLEDLPHEFVVKAGHGSGGSAIVWDGPSLAGHGHPVWFRRAYRRDDLPWHEVVGALDACLARDYGWDFLEWAYLDLPRSVVVDRLYRGSDGGVPDDLDLFVFHGRVEVIRRLTDRQRAHDRGAGSYDRDWRRLPIVGTVPEADFERPTELEQAIELAEALGAGQDFVRVDFLLTLGRPAVRRDDAVSPRRRRRVHDGGGRSAPGGSVVTSRRAHRRCGSTASSTRSARTTWPPDVPSSPRTSSATASSPTG